ncbi:MAG: chemotaxis protein CheW [Vicinamibacterales bacterium]
MAPAAQLKRMFDHTFAETPLVEKRSHDDLLAVTVGGDPYAIRVSEVVGLGADSKITWLPGSIAALLGLMGRRGVLVPVYDLCTLLGYPRASAPRWFLIAAVAPVALAFDHFEGHLRVPREAVSSDSSPRPVNQSPSLHELMRLDELARPIIHVPSVLNQIVELTHHRTGRKGSH